LVLFLGLGFLLAL